jgi:hypothetical protein
MGYRTKGDLDEKIFLTHLIRYLKDNFLTGTEVATVAGSGRISPQSR